MFSYEIFSMFDFYVVAWRQFEGLCGKKNSIATRPHLIHKSTHIYGNNNRRHIAYIILPAGRHEVFAFAAKVTRIHRIRKHI